MNEELVYFQNVTKLYNSHTVALENINLKIMREEFVAIVGKSGAGKSTLLKLLIGEEKPTKGRIFFEKQDITRLKYSELPQLRRRIGMVFQDFKLLPDKTAFENVAFALEAAGYHPKEIKETVPQMLELVGLKDKIFNFPHELSGGEKQRVAIARAMINKPDLLIADEPTGNLDPINTAEIIKLLLKINELKTTVILATHNKNVVDMLNTRVISLDNGRIIRDEEEGQFII
ncbi:MAG TPA: cell division ATP-binding protein FtsE [Candidatus Paceibacterota bacterium]|nr:cell division ATP-binding protein FtsE [Candidatus Paceibacterota bacterium]HOL54047.1 cell division ATP-binding protein FtsE [Candidatus Paceibacterota bacterium]HON22074.1 cell division ATP-binding protein FtsE [Candidatus Paceibacterota bacterium]HOV88579.1 cell division ATP-binding protein FtsE [Candidatus Paceibacterota bacterium]HPP17004.1 cell division ATP-binding protein FtsE [Candidatus Paceibacterota bacterium]